MPQEPGVMGDKKERDAMESGGTARHHHTDAAVVDKKRGRSSAPFNRNATAGQREKGTQGQCVRYWIQRLNSWSRRL